MSTDQHIVYKNVRYCNACGNPDCPKVSTDPYWRTCPAEGCPPPRIGSDNEVDL